MTCNVVTRVGACLAGVFSDWCIMRIDQIFLAVVSAGDCACVCLKLVLSTVLVWGTASD